MYSHGLLLAGTRKEGLGEGSDLLCVFHDLAGPKKLREGVCLPYNNGMPLINGIIYDIKESCMSLYDEKVTMMESLYVTSATNIGTLCIYKVMRI
jgi:hypothetical protein